MRLPKVNLGDLSRLAIGSSEKSAYVVIDTVNFKSCSEDKGLNTD
jgi:hypothetical protein